MVLSDGKASRHFIGRSKDLKQNVHVVPDKIERIPRTEVFGWETYNSFFRTVQGAKNP